MNSTHRSEVVCCVQRSDEDTFLIRISPRLVAVPLQRDRTCSTAPLQLGQNLSEKLWRLDVVNLERLWHYGHLQQNHWSYSHAVTSLVAVSVFLLKSLHR